MSPTLESPTLVELRDKILALPSEQREILIASVIQDHEIESLELHPSWKAEIDRRMKNFYDGKSELVSEEDADRELEELASRP
jgi:hypothetical protein